MNATERVAAVDLSSCGCVDLIICSFVDPLGHLATASSRLVGLPLPLPLPPYSSSLPPFFSIPSFPPSTLSLTQRMLSTSVRAVEPPSYTMEQSAKHEEKLVRVG